MSEAASAAPVLFLQDGAIATIRLNRPAEGNAINLPMAQALLEATIRCDSDPAIRCVVISAGGKLFCGGGDVSAFAAAGAGISGALSELAGTLHMAVTRLMRMAKPVLCVVQGAAAGAGFGLAIGGDIVICAESASFSPAYGGVGLTPDGGLSWLLPRLIGLRRAQEVILLNQRIDARSALDAGLVTACVPDAELEAEAAKLAQKLATLSTSAIGGAKALLLEGASSALEVQLERETRSIAAAGASPHGQEGIAAFSARRKPDFS
ncbi:MAG: enoyl-CoA hydratase-related protein [Novosphingobium sp.]|nr:enoyl-CoA hydratase-related protein [Novosphingobium sp.]